MLGTRITKVNFISQSSIKDENRAVFILCNPTAEFFIETVFDDWRDLVKSQRKYK